MSIDDAYSQVTRLSSRQILFILNNLSFSKIKMVASFYCNACNRDSYILIWFVFRKLMLRTSHTWRQKMNSCRETLRERIKKLLIYTELLAILSVSTYQPNTLFSYHLSMRALIHFVCILLWNIFMFAAILGCYI